MDWLQRLLSRLFPPLHGTGFYIAIIVCLILFVALFFVIQLLPPKARKMIIVGATFFAGLFYAAEFFLPASPKPKDENFLTFAVPTVANFQNVLTAFTLGLGIYSLVRVHGSNVLKQKPNWENSVVLLGGMIVMAVAGLGWGEKSLFYRSLFRDVLANFDGAMFAILAFFIISAAYRAFRIRSAEATLLMVSALVVMLGQIPIGQFITSGLPENGSYLSLLRLDNISNWLLTTVNAPATRAISFGLGIGALAIGLRLWLSLERGAYFEAKAE